MSGKLKRFVGGFFNRGDKISRELREQILLTTSHAELQQRGETERAWRQELGTNYELLHDDDIEDLLKRAMYKDVVVYNKEQKRYELIQGAEIDHDFAALRVIVSHLNRGSFITQADAEVMRWEVSAMLRRIKMQMRPDTYNLSVSNFLSSFRVFAEFLLSDAIEGRKAKLVKTIPRIAQVEVATTQGERRQQ